MKQSVVNLSTNGSLREKGKIRMKEFFTHDSKAYEKYLKAYLCDLFPEEIEHVRMQARKDCLVFSNEDERYLIMTLGISLEPLILAVHLVMPSAVFLLYTDEKHLDSFRRGLDSTGFDHKVRLYPVKIPKLQDASGESAAIFRLLRKKINPLNIKTPEDASLFALQQILEDPERRNGVLFDITGAKKTYSGGCLLFASYFDLPVYYMNFRTDDDHYDSAMIRPYAGSCYYTRQPNPLSCFCLKDIENISSAFDAENFMLAATLIETIIPRMNPLFFEQTEISLYEGLRDLCGVYSDWSEGWWGDVYDRQDYLPGANISYLKNLKSYPRKKSPQPLSNQTDYFEQIEGFLSFLALETATLLRADDMRTAHPRQLFLRAFVIEELLVGFICYRLFVKGMLPYSVEQPCVSMSDEEHLKTAICMNYGGLEMILTGVREYSSCMLYGMKRQSAPTVILGSPKWTTDTMRFTRFIPIIRNFSRFRRLRNKSTHSFASVDSRAAARVVNELESLIMCLLADSDFWFDSNPVPAELLNIMEDESWFRDEKVSPISFSKAQQLISFAVSSGVQPQIDIAVRHTASIF